MEAECDGFMALGQSLQSNDKCPHFDFFGEIKKNHIGFYDVGI